MDFKFMQCLPIIRIEFRELILRKKYVVILCMLIFPFTNAVAYIIPLFVPKIMIDVITNNGDWNRICVIIGTLIVIELICKLINSGIKSYLNAVFVEMRSHEMASLNAFTQQMPYKLFEDKKYNDHSYAAYESLASPEGFEGVYHTIVELLKLFVLCFVFTIVLLQASVILVIIYYGLSLVATFINLSNVTFVQQNKEYESQQRRRIANFANLGNDYTYGKDIRQYHFHNIIRQCFMKAYSSLYTIIHCYERKEMSLHTRQNIIIVVRDLLCFLIIFMMVESGTLSLGDLILYFGFISTFGDFLDQTVLKIRELLINCLVADKYYSFKKKHSQKIHNADRSQLQIKTFDILEFKNVSFRYPSGTHDILHHMTFAIHRGEHIGIVGENGVGKTTLFKILMQHYDPDTGFIYLNHEPLSSYNKLNYANMISAVFQDVNIYASSILENIVCEGSVVEKKLQKILNIVGLSSFINGLDKGIYTELRKEIEEDGIELSIGQRQRIAIARALYKESDILYFDEATSALDVEQEIQILDQLFQEEKQRTIIFISHNLSNMRSMDRILFMEQGVIVEEGSHEMLMARKGKYYNMYSLQSQYYWKRELTYGKI